MNEDVKNQALEDLLDVMGSPEAAESWLYEPIRIFAYARPIDVLETEPNLVFDLIGRMRYGVYT